MTQKSKKQTPPQLTTLRLPLSKLKGDPANARRHGRRNLRAIAASLKAFGQQVPLVVEKGTNVVIAGNGTLRAMRALGWQECDVVESDRTGKEARALAIALNRTAELAEWDDDTLAEQLRDQLLDYNLESFGWDDRHLAKLLKLEDDDLPDFGEEDGAPAAEAVEGRFALMVTCQDEHDQAALLEQLRADGYAVKVMIA